jgi:hypothetical protein
MICQIQKRPTNTRRFNNLIRIEKNAANDVNFIRCHVGMAATINEKVSRLGSRSMNILSRNCRRKFVI